MENNSENKLKFFAQYFYQKVLKHKNFNEIGFVNDTLIHSINFIDNYYLELRSIESITDDECIEYFNLKHSNSKFLINEVERKTKILDIKNEVGWLRIREKFTSIEIDFFRSKGFLVPFMNITTDQILEFGWAKIKDK